MYFQNFLELFGKKALSETRSITVPEQNRFGLPADSYGFIEAFCNEPQCDCRRVFFNVISENKKKILATIYWGWETPEYYKTWMHDEKFDASMMIGPGLNETSPQSPIAPQLLNLCSAILLSDEQYLSRVKRHYELFRQKINAKGLSFKERLRQAGLKKLKK